MKTFIDLVNYTVEKEFEKARKQFSSTLYFRISYN